MELTYWIIVAVFAALLLLLIWGFYRCYVSNREQAHILPIHGYSRFFSDTTQRPSTGYGSISSVTTQRPSTGYGSNSSVTTQRPSTGYGSNSSVTTQRPSTGYGSDSSVTTQRPFTGYGSNSSVTTQRPSTRHELLSSVTTHRASSGTMQKLSTGYRTPMLPPIPPSPILHVDEISPDSSEDQSRSSDSSEDESRRPSLSRQYSISSTGSLNLHLRFGDLPVSKVISWEDGKPKLDLHNMTVKEAVKVTKKFLTGSEGMYCKIRIVTGRGAHSEGGVPKLKPAIENLLSESGYSFKCIYNGGCLEVDL